MVAPTTCCHFQHPNAFVHSFGGIPEGCLECLSDRIGRHVQMVSEKSLLRRKVVLVVTDSKMTWLDSDHVQRMIWNKGCGVVTISGWNSQLQQIHSVWVALRSIATNAKHMNDVTKLRCETVGPIPLLQNEWICPEAKSLKYSFAARRKKLRGCTKAEKHNQQVSSDSDSDSLSTQRIATRCLRFSCVWPK